MGLLLFILVVFSGCSATEYTLNKRVISNPEFKEILVVTDKKPVAKPKRSYYWFKSQKVHSSQNDYAGALLDGDYTKYYYSNQLAEKGKFNKGLKTGKWISWHENGTVSSVTKWNTGRTTGKYIARDNEGNTTVYGSYLNGLKQGKWIYPIKKDTLIYKKGRVQVLDSSLQHDTLKKSFFKRLFTKKTKQDHLKNTANKNDVNQKNRVLEDSKKQGFFSKLFKKNNGTKKVQKSKTISAKNVVPKQNKNNTTATDQPNFFQRLFKKKDKSKKNIKE